MGRGYTDGERRRRRIWPRRAGASRIRRAGAIGCEDGSVAWRVWAPAATEVTLVLIERREAPRNLDGPRAARLPLCRQNDVDEGQRYCFRLDGGPDLPDPCSLWQPEGVFGPSAVVFPDRFRVVRREAGKVFDLSILSSTRSTSARSRLMARSRRSFRGCRDLVELGVTAVEIMPVGAVFRRAGWGYDGVFAVRGSRCLRRPAAVCRAWWTHATPHGLAIFLDVVYNHFGPEGNILRAFGPYLTDRYKTPWGAAVNFDRAGCDAGARLRARQRSHVARGVSFRRSAARCGRHDFRHGGPAHSAVRSRRRRTRPAAGAVGRRS